MTDLSTTINDESDVPQSVIKTALGNSSSSAEVECEASLRELSLHLKAGATDSIDDDFTPKAEYLPDIAEGCWLNNDRGSIDLDERFATMTGSYSEISENNSPKHVPSTDREGKRNRRETSEEEEAWSIRNRDDTLIDGALAALHFCSQESYSLQTSYLMQETDVNSMSDERYACLLPNLLYGPHLPRSFYPQPPLVDPDVLTDLEEEARRIATSMDTLTENLTETLHGISALSVDCIETYRDAVCKTCDAVDSNIKSMYQLMAKCEELSKAMKPMYKLHEQIKEIRRLLDLYENAVYSGGT